jgi:hypothetical protein
MKKITQKTLLIAFGAILAVSVAFAMAANSLLFTGSGTLGTPAALVIRAWTSQNVLTTVPAGDIGLANGATVGAVSVSGDAQTMTFDFMAFPTGGGAGAGSAITTRFSVVNTTATPQNLGLGALNFVNDVTITLSNGVVIGAGSPNPAWRDVSALFLVEIGTAPALGDATTPGTVTAITNVAGQVIPANGGVNMGLVKTMLVGGATELNTLTGFEALGTGSVLDGAMVSFALELGYTA